MFYTSEISKLKNEIFLLHLKQAWALLSWGWKPFSKVCPILVAKCSEKAKQAQGDTNQ